LSLIQSRSAAGLPQAALAEKVNIAPRNFSLYENGRSKPREETVRKIASVLNCDVAWLATGQNVDTQRALAAQYSQRVACIPTQTATYIEEWTGLCTLNSLPIWALKTFNPDPNTKSPNHSLDPREFAHWVCDTVGRFRATRYPGSFPANCEFPAGTILVFDSGPVTAETLRDGDVVIYRLAEEDGAPRPASNRARAGCSRSDADVVEFRAPAYSIQ
jgi:transcriptional regulator with XRE-family HTH domain